MKIPSLTRLPSHRQFGVTPRYYDPIKEDIEERTSRIKQELKTGEEQSEGEYVQGRITFERKTKSFSSSSFRQLFIAAALGGSTVGWLYYGNQFFYYAAFLIIPVYVYLRFIRKIFVK
jgi:hypothetical protein